MSEKRFELGKGDKGLLIYDNEGVDDYYFVNDKEELQEFCDLINERESKIHNLEHTIALFEVIAEQSKYQMGSLAFMNIKSLAYPNTVLYIEKDEEEHGAVKIYVKKDYDELLLKAFLKETLILGLKYKILTVNEVKTKEIKEDYML